LTEIEGNYDFITILIVKFDGCLVSPALWYHNYGDYELMRWRRYDESYRSKSVQ